MKNRPKLPTSVAISINVGTYPLQADGQEVAVQRGDDDDEALEPHADVDEQRG